MISCLRNGCEVQFLSRACGHGRVKIFCSRSCKAKHHNETRTPEQLRANLDAIACRRAEGAPGRGRIASTRVALRAVRAEVKAHVHDLAAQERAARPKQRPRQKVQQWIDDYKTSRGCQVCSVAAPAYILDLHHVDPATKAFGLSRAKSLKSAMLEAAKCVVLCAVHHRMVEAGDIPCPTKES